MTFIDVIFPLNVGPLTYRLPAGYDGTITPGVPVRAEVKKTLRYGIVLRETPGIPKGPVKEIAEVIRADPLYSQALTSLVSWMADYYLTPEGIVLKSMLPKEVFERQGRVKAESVVMGSRRYPAETDPVDPGIMSQVKESISDRQYRTYLLHVQTVRQEISFLSEMIRGIRNVIILAPEISFLEGISSVVDEIAGERLAILHGQLSKAGMRSGLHRIISGQADIVLGTRPAIFAPLKSVSLVVVLQEHNRSYKNLDGPRYHARDVAVMRGYLERATVVLSSPTPSLESFYNTVKSKYLLLRPAGEVRRPRIEIINMKTAKKETPYLSRRSLQAAASHINNKGNVLFLINRKGYSMLQCGDCDNIPSCPGCRAPLIYHKSGAVLKCHFCNYSFTAPEFCGKCRSTNLQMLGAGTQRIASDLKGFLDVEPLRFDKDSIRDNPGLKDFSDNVERKTIVVGTKAFAREFNSTGLYHLCVFLNPDIGLHLPDFRSSEIIFQEIFAMSEFINPEGLIVVQTRMPESSVYRHVKRYSFTHFFAEELSARKTLMYPPFSRMIAITVSSSTDKSRILKDTLPASVANVDIIGPMILSKKGKHTWKILLKSSSRQGLGRYARRFLDVLKNEKGLRVTVDVDPISL